MLPETGIGATTEQAHRFPAVASDHGTVGTKPITQRQEFLGRRRGREAPRQSVALPYTEVVDRPDVQARDSNIRYISAVHRPMPRTVTRPAITSSSAFLRLPERSTVPSSTLCARSRTDATLFPDRPAARSSASGTATMASAVSWPPAAETTRPRIVYAARPLSCWETMARPARRSARRHSVAYGPAALPTQRGSPSPIGVATSSTAVASEIRAISAWCGSGRRRRHGFARCRNSVASWADRGTCPLSAISMTKAVAAETPFKKSCPAGPG